MNFDSLENKCKYYRSLTDYRLLPNSYVLVMIDGKNFSKKIKKKFKQPFDNIFIDIMNQVALHVCNNVQGCKFAYTQSDEITFVLTDFDTIETDCFFNYRLEKMCSIIASFATSKFNQLMYLHELDSLKEIVEILTTKEAKEYINELPLYEFDCKAWNVPTYNDVFAYILWRQLDCIRNSKQQAARTYLSHNTCNGKNTDELVEILKTEKHIDWNKYNNSKKFGRFIYKEEVTMKSEEYGEFTRDKFTIHDAWQLSEETGKLNFEQYSNIPKLY